MKKQNKGITLVVLVITIIIILIITGVTLSATLGEKGLFRLASLAGKNYKDAENKELEEIDKLFSSILVADNGQITLTTEELNTYIDKKVEEKIQTTKDELSAVKTELETTKSSLAQTVSALNTTIASLQAKDTLLETSINEINNLTYTELARTTSTTRGNVVKLNDSLTKYKYIWVVRKAPSGNLHGSGIIPVNVFKTAGEYVGANNGAEQWAYAKYKSESEVYLYRSANSSNDDGIAILYGIK